MSAGYVELLVETNVFEIVYETNIVEVSVCVNVVEAIGIVSFRDINFTLTTDETQSRVGK